MCRVDIFIFQKKKDRKKNTHTQRQLKKTYNCKRRQLKKQSNCKEEKNCMKRIVCV